MDINEDLKQKIQPIAFGQKQVGECSHLLVFAAWEKYSRERIDQVFDYLSSERNIPASETMGQRHFAIDYFSQMSVEDNFHHAAKQAHIALGLAIAACATQGIDATPMEGFDKTALRIRHIHRLKYKHEKDACSSPRHHRLL